jgi:hypothetical protein
MGARTLERELAGIKGELADDRWLHSIERARWNNCDDHGLRVQPDPIGQVQRCRRRLQRDL